MSQSEVPPETPSKLAKFPWLRVSFFLLVCGFLFLTIAPRIARFYLDVKKASIETPVEPQPAEEIPKIKEPIEPVVKSGGDIRKMSKGFSLETKVSLREGGSASEERVSDTSYVASYELKVNLPQPTKTMEGLEKTNPHLGKVLPGLASMLPDAGVSPYFHAIYGKKVERLKSKSTKLDELLTMHNLYDCETILNLTNPETGRKVLLVQAEMDVVSDGSDGDRLPVMPDEIVNSTHYQPMTSYGWKKTGTTPNPLIAGWKKRIGKANAEIALASTKPERSKWLKERIKKINLEIDDMEARSFLIADYDPFIVMPVDMVLTRHDSHMAKIGDYAVVIYKNKAYPAIVGDAGPSYKMGEASLRMCKELNPSSSSYSRPVSDLAVTYLVFTRSADKFGEPDYDVWYQRCSELLAEIGGLGDGIELHKWKNTLPVPSAPVIETITSDSAPDKPASAPYMPGQGTITPIRAGE